MTSVSIQVQRSDGLEDRWGTEPVTRVMSSVSYPNYLGDEPAQLIVPTDEPLHFRVDSDGSLAIYTYADTQGRQHNEWARYAAGAWTRARRVYGQPKAAAVGAAWQLSFRSRVGHLSASPAVRHSRHNASG